MQTRWSTPKPLPEKLSASLPNSAKPINCWALSTCLGANYDRALVEIRRAIEINPSDAYSYASLGTALNYSGDASGAIAAFDKARVFDPTLQWNLSSLGFAYYLAGRYEEAVAVLEPLAESDSDPSAYAALAAAYAELGRTQDAERAAGEVRRLWPFFETNQFVRQWKDEQSRRFLAQGLAKAGLK